MTARFDIFIVPLLLGKVVAVGVATYVIATPTLTQILAATVETGLVTPRVDCPA